MAEPRKANGPGKPTPGKVAIPTTTDFAALHLVSPTREEAKRLLVPEVRVSETNRRDSIHEKEHIPTMYPPLPHQQMIQMATKQILIEECRGCDDVEKLGVHPGSVPHNAECQKHAWHKTSLGLAAKVNDEWGFSSTGGSRCESPNPQEKQVEVSRQERAQK